MVEEKKEFRCKYCGKIMHKVDFELNNGYCGKCKDLIDWKRTLDHVKELKK